MPNEHQLTQEQLIEALLFWKGEPLSTKEIASYLSIKKEEVAPLIDSLETSLATRGIVLIRKEDEVTLGTHPQASAVIEKLRKEELSKDLGKAGLETLAIILYKGPVKRAEIDYIRGVNSQFILRNLLVRGLIERVPAPDDQRAILYKTSFDLLQLLGITDVTKLPRYDEVLKEIESFKMTQEGIKQSEASPESDPKPEQEPDSEPTDEPTIEEESAELESEQSDRQPN